MPPIIPLSLDNITESEIQIVTEILEKNKDLVKQRKYFELINNIDEIYYASLLTLILYKSGIDPLKYMTRVPDYYLAYTDIKEITIPEGIIFVGYNVFKHCKNLNKITLPKSLKWVGAPFCDDCESLRQVHYMGTNAEFDSINFGLGENAMPDSFINVDRIICSDDKYN